MRPDVRLNCQLSALPDLDDKTSTQDDMTNRQNDTTSRQNDIENRHRVIFDPNYRSTAPRLPYLLVNRAKSENGAFILV